MTIIVDASVVVAALIDSGSNGVWAEGVLLGDTLAAPELLFIESTNVLRRLEAGRVISAPEARAAHRDLLNLDIEPYPFLPLAEQVWSYRQNLTSYDATYVALAITLGSPLATLDKKMASQADICQFLLP